MNESTVGSHAVWKYELEVGDRGRVELNVPLASGARVVVYVVPEDEAAFSDLLAASESSAGFWDNTLDDEDWNDASPR